MLLDQGLASGHNSMFIKENAMKVRLILASLALTPLSALACSELLENSYRPLSGKVPESLCARFEGKFLLVVNTASKCGLNAAIRRP